MALNAHRLARSITPGSHSMLTSSRVTCRGREVKGPGAASCSAPPASRARCRAAVQSLGSGQSTAAGDANDDQSAHCTSNTVAAWYHLRGVIADCGHVQRIPAFVAWDEELAAATPQEEECTQFNTLDTPPPTETVSHTSLQSPAFTIMFFLKLEFAIYF